MSVDKQEKYSFRQVLINGETVTRFVDKDGKDAPPAYTVKVGDKVIPVAKPVLVALPCSDCKQHGNVYASIIHMQVRVLCVQCLSEMAGRWLQAVHEPRL